MFRCLVGPKVIFSGGSRDLNQLIWEELDPCDKHMWKMACLPDAVSISPYLSELIAIHGSKHQLDWCHNKFNVDPYKYRMFKRASYNGNVTAMKWLVDELGFTSYRRLEYYTIPHLDVLKWMKERRITIVDDMASNAVVLNMKDSVLWLRHHWSGWDDYLIELAKVQWPDDIW